MNDFHTLSINQTLKKIESSESGLSSEEAKSRAEKFGPNSLTSKKKTSRIILLLNQFASPLVYILIIAAVVAWTMKSALDAQVILLIVIINALFGYFYEIKTEKALEALEKIINLKSRIKRDGNFIEIDSVDIVNGDIVEIVSGMKIPADIRIIELYDLTVDESSLTGESEPVVKKEVIIPPNTLLSDRVNMLYAGTMIISGRGAGVVVETGDSTEFGHIAQEVTDTTVEPTLLQKQLALFSRKLLYLVIIAMIFLIVLGLSNHMAILDIVLVAIAVAIAVIPEGLPAVITITLAYGAFKMSKRKAIVRKLSAVETLGSITVIASDKTGTLTHNQQTVKKVYTLSNIFDVEGSGYEPRGMVKVNDKKINIHEHPDLFRLATLGVLCNDANIFERETGDFSVEGDPTEGALTCFALKNHIDKETLDEKMPRLDEIPFETINTYMATLHKSKGKNILVVKGSIEKMLDFSDYILKNNKKIKLTAEIKKQILEENNKFARSALRVLAISYLETNAKTIDKSDLKNMIFVGFFGMIDPPRNDAKQAIASCRLSGIRTIMITGDYPITAQAVAFDLGIINDRLENVVTGAEIEKMSDEKFKSTIKTHSVYARITPEMKLQIVEELQKQGELVAVTGDGINDAPALKKADIGVAMGKGGTDVTREVADLVLLDNNFATIVAAIEEGRTIFQNIRRSVFFLLSTNIGELLIIAFGLILGWPLLLLPVQILWMNLITDGTANIALSLEPTHIGLMKYKPRKTNEPILNGIILRRIFVVAVTMTLGVWFIYNYGIRNNFDMILIRTYIFGFMIIIQLLNTFNARSLRDSLFKLPLFNNPFLLVSIAISFAISLSTFYVGFARKIFQISYIDFSQWLILLLISFVIIFVVEIEKIVARVRVAKF
ncbi:MAG: HAD-IC family P-type ATPase [Patescibacteria group bacterium]